MKMMYEILIYLGIGILTGLIGKIAISLSGYILKIEDGEVCNCCRAKDECFARKPIIIIRRKSDYVSEFMWYSYYKVRPYCPCIEQRRSKKEIWYIIFNFIIIGVLFCVKGITGVTIIWSISAAALLALSVVDWNTQYIPFEMNGVIFVCGLIRLFTDLSNWTEYVIGLIAVSGFLLLMNKLATPIFKEKYEDVEELGAVIGDGDMKLMAATGLLLGWKLNFFALAVGAITGSIMELLLMKIKGSNKPFALGPYLSLGVYIAMICGEQLISWYLNMLGM